MNNEHRENLQTLATFLAYGPRRVDFDMKSYSTNADSGTDCGTAGCAVGHASFVFTKRPHEAWTLFAERIFGMGTGVITPAWLWCFQGDWRHSDNSRLGAAKRIQYLLDRGVPAGFNLSSNTRDFQNIYQNIEVKRGDSKALISDFLSKMEREIKSTGRGTHEPLNVEKESTT